MPFTTGVASRSRRKGRACVMLGRTRWPRARRTARPSRPAAARRRTAAALSSISGIESPCRAFTAFARFCTNLPRCRSVKSLAASSEVLNPAARRAAGRVGRCSATAWSRKSVAMGDVRVKSASSMLLTTFMLTTHWNTGFWGRSGTRSLWASRPFCRATTTTAGSAMWPASMRATCPFAVRFVATRTSEAGPRHEGDVENES
mmetsp:Transcript_8912/g.25482  ORF Transcript_8912/g.25482 Transcript_8912/m.25482 type:complete len:203 (-) Transcript_8912:237-845(-)